MIRSGILFILLFCANLNAQENIQSSPLVSHIQSPSFAESASDYVPVALMTGGFAVAGVGALINNHQFTVIGIVSVAFAAIISKIKSSYKQESQQAKKNHPLTLSF
jgi:hypothetical protein